MTATRWWVRMAARWIARLDSVKSHLNLVFQAMTGVSLASGALKYFGMTWAVGPFIAFVAGGVLVYAYLYAEGGVWNQVSRDRTDMSSNFSGPNQLMDNPQIGCAVFAAVHGRRPDEEERKTIHDAVKDQWLEYRDGVDLETGDNHG